jgi:hypothetical protein
VNFHRRCQQFDKKTRSLNDWIRLREVRRQEGLEGDRGAVSGTILASGIDERAPNEHLTRNSNRLSRFPPPAFINRTTPTPDPLVVPPPTHDNDEMAKSARATSVKKNRQNLKKKVFGPVEAARNERLSAKLLELASKAKRPRPEMEVEQDGMTQLDNKPRLDTLESNQYTSTESTNPSEEATENKTTEGASNSPSISIPIPACLLHHNDHLPTPPLTPTLDASATTMPILDTLAQRVLAKEMLFFHLLGTSTDIIGFDDNGELELSFAAPG